MNSDVPIRQRPPAPGPTPQPDSRLIEIDLDHASGAFNRLVGVLQEQHGWNRVRASKELLRRMAKQRGQRGRSLSGQ
jgi:hypothetical protein